MTGYHTRWVRPEEPVEDPERIAIREALAFGKALYDIRTALGLSVAELALRAALTDDDLGSVWSKPTPPELCLVPMRRVSRLSTGTAGGRALD